MRVRQGDKHPPTDRLLHDLLPAPLCASPTCGLLLLLCGSAATRRLAAPTPIAHRPCQPRKMELSELAQHLSRRGPALLRLARHVEPCPPVYDAVECSAADNVICAAHGFQAWCSAVSLCVLLQLSVFTGRRGPGTARALFELAVFAAQLAVLQDEHLHCVQALLHVAPAPLSSRVGAR